MLGTNWDKMTTVTDIMKAICDVLVNPVLDAAIEPEIATIYNEDNAKYLATAKEWTLKYA